MKDIVHELDARNQINLAILRAARGIDRLDRAMIASAYHPGAIDHHGSFDGPVEDFIEWVMERHPREGIVYSLHLVSNIYVELHSGFANSESYLVGIQRIDENGKFHDRIGCGRYLDRLDERDGVWKIAERTAIADWSRLEQVDAQWTGALIEMVAQGRRDDADPSYAWFKRVSA